jgi:hypothetical protein
VCVHSALSQSALNSNTGLYTNMLANDGERIFYFCHFLPTAIAGVGGTPTI